MGGLIKNDSRVNSADGYLLRLLRWLSRLVGLPKETRGVATDNDALLAAYADTIAFAQEPYWQGSAPIKGALDHTQHFGTFWFRPDQGATPNRIRQSGIRPQADEGEASAGEDRNIYELARSYLDKADEDWTWVDPEDVKCLARYVVEHTTE